MPREYSAEFTARAVRLVRDRLGIDETLSHRAAMIEVGSRLGVSAGTVRRWFHDPEVNEGLESDSLADEVRRLRRENAQLREVNEILKATSAFFASEPGTDPGNDRDVCSLNAIISQCRNPVRR